MYGHGLKDLKTVFSAVARIVRTVPRVALEAAPGDCWRLLRPPYLWIHVPRQDPRIWYRRFSMSSSVARALIRRPLPSRVLRAIRQLSTS